MGVKLPGALTGLLNELGYLWPEVDEDGLQRMATAWIGFGGRLDGIVGQADDLAEAVRRGNEGEAIGTFLSAWTGENAPRAVVAGGGTGARIVAVCLMLAAALVRALKVVIIVQLVLLLVRIRLAQASAVATSGGSLLTIPAQKQITRLMLKLAGDQASRVLVA
ncbi:WXG100-like domain-containing protein [Sphaerisporangium fuscum]|uniref:WXG100-like domain-containing protein n=1 Tax=Sphaerisporangium fuscum TaxID=2835868 RepID=UPI001BDD3DC9|nr:hypothetical protein [Sphaerisporangium fuscum]